jgi:hypothetical protein
MFGRLSSAWLVKEVAASKQSERAMFILTFKFLIDCPS